MTWTISLEPLRKEIIILRSKIAQTFQVELYDNQRKFFICKRHDSGRAHSGIWRTKIALIRIKVKSRESKSLELAWKLDFSSFNFGVKTSRSSSPARTVNRTGEK